MDYQKLIRYRSVWMGVAMLWIVWFHVPLVPAGEGMAFFRKLGYGGVDMCLFASGVGCFYSLQKDPDAGRFMGRRLRRLAPVYLTVMALWLPWQYSRGAATIPTIIGNLFGIQHLTTLNSDFNWYISAILLLYIFAPYLKSVIDSHGLRGRALFLAVLLVLVIPFWMSGEYIIVITRIPVFYMGMLFAAGAGEGRRINAWQWPLGFVLMAFAVAVIWLGFERIPDKMWAYGVYWCPYVLIAPYLCVVLSTVMSWLDRTAAGRAVVRALSVVGEYSFEIYLLHIPMVDIVSEMITNRGLGSHRTPIWLASLCVLAVACVVLRKTAELAVRLLKRG